MSICTWAPDAQFGERDIVYAYHVLAWGQLACATDKTHVTTDIFTVSCYAAAFAAFATRDACPWRCVFAAGHVHKYLSCI